MHWGRSVWLHGIAWGTAAWINGVMSATLTVHSECMLLYCRILSPFYNSTTIPARWFNATPAHTTVLYTIHYWGPAAGNPIVGLVRRKNGQKLIESINSSSSSSSYYSGTALYSSSTSSAITKNTLNFSAYPPSHGPGCC